MRAEHPLLPAVEPGSVSLRCSELVPRKQACTCSGEKPRTLQCLHPLCFMGISYLNIQVAASVQRVPGSVASQAEDSRPLGAVCFGVIQLQHPLRELLETFLVPRYMLHLGIRMTR